MCTTPEGLRRFHTRLQVLERTNFWAAEKLYYRRYIDIPFVIGTARVTCSHIESIIDRRFELVLLLPPIYGE